MKTKAVIKVISALFSRNNDNDSGGKKAGITVLVISLMLVLVPAATISVPGLILKGLVNKICSFFTGGNDDPDFESIDMDNIEIDENFDITKSDIYSLTKDTYISYNTDLDKEFNSFVEEITKKYTYKVKKTHTESVRDENGNIVFDEDGNPQQTEVTEEIEVKPEIQKNTNIIKPQIQLPLAYITTSQQDIVTESDQYCFDEDEMIDFLNSITTVNKDAYVIHDYTDGQPKVIACNMSTIIKTAEEVAKERFSESKYPDDYVGRQELYVLSYESLLDIDDTDVVKSYEYIDLSTFDIYANGMEIPHFLQYDARWKDIPYGSRNIQFCGCGPTCLGMIISYLNNETVTPDIVAAWAGDKYWDQEVGSSWDIYPDAAAHYGLKCKRLSMDIREVITALGNGQPVIASMCPGTFTKNGHFIVLRGVTGEGKILVNDPNDNTSDKNYAKREFEPSLILNESKGFWAFSK